VPDRVQGQVEPVCVCAGVTLTYDPGQQTLRCTEGIALTIGNGR
jgi:hypothetical protein